MASTTAFVNSMLDTAFTGTITMKLFTGGLPTASGVEVSGGSYTAQTLTLGAAASKTKATTSNVIFSDLPTGTPIVAYGIYKGGTLVHEELLAPAFTPDVTNNELEISFSYSLNV